MKTRASLITLIGMSVVAEAGAQGPVVPQGPAPTCVDLASDAGWGLVGNPAISTASTRAESASLSAERVVKLMAGEGPRPDTNSAITDRTFLALAQESKRFEDELAEALAQRKHIVTCSPTVSASPPPHINSRR
jgi:hypothetical protein